MGFLPRSLISTFSASVLYFLPSQLQAEPKNNNDIIHVDRHIVLVVDQSSSMDNSIDMAMRGYAETLTYDEEIKAQMHSGVRFAFSLVFFAKEGQHTVSEIIPDHEKLVQFSHKNLWNFDKEQRASKPYIEDGTFIYQAYITTDLLLRNEARYGFVADSRTVLITGDEAEDAQCANIKEMATRLARQYNAVVHALPVMNHYEGWSTGEWGQGQGAQYSVQQFYNNCVRTQEDSYYLAGDNLLVPIVAGTTAPIDDIADYRESLRRAVNLVYW